jgi:hypothetical protein
LRRAFLACLTCLCAIAAIVLAWVPVYSTPPAGPSLQEPMPPEGWTVCEVGELEYIQEVNEVRQVFKVCNAQGWEIKVFCTQPGIPAPGDGTGCSYEPGGTFWCGGSVQVLKFFAIIQEPPPTETPTPTPVPTDTPTAVEPSATEGTPGTIETAYPVDTPSDPIETSYPIDTPTDTLTVDPGIATLTSTGTAVPNQATATSTVQPFTNTPRPYTTLPNNGTRPFPGGQGNRGFVVLTLLAMAIAWGITIWAVVLRRRPGRS